MHRSQLPFETEYLQNIVWSTMIHSGWNFEKINGLSLFFLSEWLTELTFFWYSNEEACVIYSFL